MRISPEYATLRIVCLTCMRDAKVLHAERDSSRRAVLVHVQCHGASRLAFASDIDQKPDRPVLWEDLDDMIDVEGALVRDESFMLEAADRVALFQSFLRARSAAQT